MMSACTGTVLPLSFTEEIQTLEGVSVAENVNVKRLSQQHTGRESVVVESLGIVSCEEGTGFS